MAAPLMRPWENRTVNGVQEVASAPQAIKIAYRLIQ
jgi:hypothetical protein